MMYIRLARGIESWIERLIDKYRDGFMDLRRDTEIDRWMDR